MRAKSCQTIFRLKHNRENTGGHTQDLVSIPAQSETSQLIHFCLSDKKVRTVKGSEDTRSRKEQLNLSRHGVLTQISAWNTNDSLKARRQALIRHQDLNLRLLCCLSYTPPSSPQPGEPVVGLRGLPASNPSGLLCVKCVEGPSAQVQSPPWWPLLPTSVYPSSSWVKVMRGGSCS